MLKIYLFGDVENNPEMSFLALLILLSLSRTLFSNVIFVLAAMLDFRAAILKIGLILIG